MTIYLIVFAGLLSFTNYIGSRVLMSLYALELGASALAVGLLISLYAVFPFAVSVYAGRLVDRVGSFQPMLLGNAGSIADPRFRFRQAMAAGMSRRRCSYSIYV